MKFWQKWYFPANATLYLVGDFGRSVEETKALVERYFGGVPAVREDAPLEPFQWGQQSRASQISQNGSSHTESPRKQRHEARPSDRLPAVNAMSECPETL